MRRHPLRAINQARAEGGSITRMQPVTQRGGRLQQPDRTFSMNVASICSRHIVSVHRDETLPQAARLMREHHVGSVVVTEARADGDHVVGLVTDRDLVIEVLARGLEGAAMPLAALVGNGPLLSVPEEADFGEAIALMQTGGVRRLLVRDAQGHLVGVLSFDDLMRVCGAQMAGLAAVLARGQVREHANTGPLDEPRALPPSPPPPAPAAAPKPRLRVPAMGTAGWPMPSDGLR
jgi:CBS domain-containing protein